MALAQDPQGRVLYAHTVNRFEDLDLEFFSALQRAGLLAERVWAAPDRPPTPEEPFAELFPQQWVGIYEIIQWGPDPGPQRP